MLEVEMKFPADDLWALAKHLAAEKYVADEPLWEADHYFNAPDRDFAQTDEALRLRRIGSANFVTYKGPKRDLETKTRTEIEVPLADGAATAEDFMSLLQQLKYRPVAVVRKKRRVYHQQRAGMALEVCLDEVEGVGAFVELEIQAPEDQYEPARKILLETAGHLGLGTSERRSYLEMLLEKKKA